MRSGLFIFSVCLALIASCGRPLPVGFQCEPGDCRAPLQCINGTCTTSAQNEAIADNREPSSEPKKEAIPETNEPKTETNEPPKETTPEPRTEPKAEPKTEPISEPSRPDEPVVDTVRDAAEPIPETTPEPECVDGVNEKCTTANTGCTKQKCLGECKFGLRSCTKGRWDQCQGEVTPIAEVCDDKDNDCDGLVDEGITRPCPNTQACNSQQTCPSNGTCGGRQKCIKGKWESNCTGVPNRPTETCNNTDDDCDGLVDEGLFCTRLVFSNGLNNPVQFNVITGLQVKADKLYAVGVYFTPTQVSSWFAQLTRGSNGLLSLTETYYKGPSKQPAAPNALVRHPMDILLFGSGSMLITNNFGNRISLFTPGATPATHQLANFVGQDLANAFMDGPAPSTARTLGVYAIARSQNNNIFFTEDTHHLIRRVTPTKCSGAATNDQWCTTTIAGKVPPTTVGGYQDGPANDARFNAPRGIITDKNGDILVADTLNHSIRKITEFTKKDTCGMERFHIGYCVTTYAGTATMPGNTDGPLKTAQFNQPHDMVFDSSGNLYIADQGNVRLRMIDIAGNVTTVLGLPQANKTLSVGTAYTPAAEVKLPVPGATNSTAVLISGLGYDRARNALYVGVRDLIYEIKLTQ